MQQNEKKLKGANKHKKEMKLKGGPLETVGQKVTPN